MSRYNVAQNSALVILCAALVFAAPLAATAAGTSRHGKHTASAPPVHLSAKQIFARYSDAVVHIDTDLGSGTGFFLDDGRAVITCYHVVKGAISIKITDSHGNVIPIVKIGVDPSTDSAVIFTAVTEKHRSLTISTGPPPTPGEAVFVIGDPLGFLTRSITEGILSGTRKSNGVTLYQFTAPISPGSSGSPLIDDRGNVLGFVSFTLIYGQSLNMAFDLRQAAGVFYRGFRTAAQFYADNKAAAAATAATAAPASTAADAGGEAVAPSPATTGQAPSSSDDTTLPPLTVALHQYTDRWSGITTASIRVLSTWYITAQRHGGLTDDLAAVRAQLDALRAAAASDYQTDIPATYHADAITSADDTLLSTIVDLDNALTADVRESYSGTTETIKNADEKTYVQFRRVGNANYELYRAIEAQPWFDLSTFISRLSNVAFVCAFGRLGRVLPDIAAQDQALVAWAPDTSGLKSGDIIVRIAALDGTELAEVRNWRDVAQYQIKHPDQKNFRLTVKRGADTIVVLTDMISWTTPVAVGRRRLDTLPVAVTG